MARTALVHEIPAVATDVPIAVDPVESAKQAGLRYVSDTGPGIRRRKAGKGFCYVGVDGQPVDDRKVLARIKKLAIPPAWTDVWISPLANGHIQATGRDARGRKQYRYHERWAEVRDETKYHRMIAFGEALPEIRERVDADLGERGLTRERVLATILKLLDETAIRVGNERYTAENGSFGLTTLRNHHVDVDGAVLHFHFRSKGGKYRRIDVRDRRVARVVRRCEDLPGQELFHYLDEEGEARTVHSEDVNAYLRDISGQDFTAKDFRTWHGTVAAAQALVDIGPFETQSEAKHQIAEAVKEAAGHLGNTPAICRKSYVHPAVIDTYLEGELAPAFARFLDSPPIEGGLSREERAVLHLLQQQLIRESESQSKAS